MHTTSDLIKTLLSHSGDSTITPDASYPTPLHLDGSENIQWAASQWDVDLPIGSDALYAYCSRLSQPISTASALLTRGALLFLHKRVSISLGDAHTTLGAFDFKYGTSTLDALYVPWESAALLPGFTVKVRTL
jgi:hypothetical protein